MPLSVSYKNRIGYFTHKEKYKEIVQNHKIWICHANAVCAFMYFYKDEKGTDMVQLCGFVADMQHLKNMLKDELFSDWKNWHFRAKEMNAELWKMVKLLAEAGIKVTVE